MLIFFYFLDLKDNNIFLPSYDEAYPVFTQTVPPAPVAFRAKSINGLL